MNRTFWYLWSAQTFSALGDSFGYLSVGWMAYQKTGSEVIMATLVLAYLLPEILVRLVGAPLVDRVDKRRLMAALDLVRGAAWLFPVTTATLGSMEIWHLYAAAAVAGSCAALHWPASLATLPSILKGDELVRGNAMIDASTMAANLVGPVAAGWLIKWAGAVPALGFDSLTFLWSAGFVMLLPPLVSGGTPQKGAAGYLREALEGVAFFRSTPALLVLMLILSVSNMGTNGIFAMLIPFAQKHLSADPVGVGMLQTSFAVGWLSGSALAGWVGDVQNRRLPMLGSLAAAGLMIAGLGLMTNLYAALAMAAANGLAGSFFNPYSASLFGRLVPKRLQGRVMSVRLLIGQGARPLGVALAGIGAESVGLPAVYVLAGLIPAVVALSGFFLPALRGIDGELPEAA